MCTSPNMMVWRGQYTATGHKKWIFEGRSSFLKMTQSCYQTIEVPCGKCIECKQNQASMWSDRCVFESMSHEHNYFITLTYDDVHLPLDGCLHQEHMQKFLKRLRKFYKKKGFDEIKYFYAAEYGSKSYRPHYHIILFGLEIDDLSDIFEEKKSDGRYHKHRRPDGTKSKYSRNIYDLWNCDDSGGFISVDEFNYNTAAYVAGYCMKKADPVHLKIIEKFNLVPEFHRMSLKPAIGAGMFSPDMFDKPFLIIPRSGDAKHSPVPRYYEKLLDREYPWKYNELRIKRDLEREKKFNAVYLDKGLYQRDIELDGRASRNKARGCNRKI